MIRFIGISLFILLLSNNLYSQSAKIHPFATWDFLVLQVDTSSFDSRHNVIVKNKKAHLAFEFSNNEQIINGELYLKKVDKKINLLPSNDFDILDSLKLINNTYYQFKIRMKDISNTDFLALIFEVEEGDGFVNYQIPLLPYTQTKATFYGGKDDLFLGEIRKFEIITNNVENLQLDGEWKETQHFNYRLEKDGNQAFIYIDPKTKGENVFSLNFKTKQPFVNKNGIMSYTLPSVEHKFKVKESRLTFLRINPRDITLDIDNLEGEEVTIENNRFLSLEKTYRIATSEKASSPLIAELYTKERLSNDRVLCLLRPYRTHSVSDGFLYIKDQDAPRFLTNLEISPKTEIADIQILREGKSWTSDLTIKPGENFDIRITGKSLMKANFHFEEIIDITSDTLNQSNQIRNYKIQVPINLNKTTLNIMNGTEKTGKYFRVIEHKKPRPLDFVLVNYGEENIPINELDYPVLYQPTIKDVVISFNRNKIDEKEMLYGTQVINIKVRMEDKEGNLVETKNFGNFTICPDVNSPRHAFYQSENCRLDDILINNFLSKKTYNLNEWGKVEITFEHVKEAHNSEGYSQKVVIYNQKRIRFDIDVSFPAGLVTQKVGPNETLSPLLGGIGLAMLAQFSFYKKNEIKKELPVKIGAGFLAQNAFNFNPDAERDLGIVVIGSVYPIRTKRNFSFPLYAGFGYFVQESKFFFLFGPGISVAF